MTEKIRDCEESKTVARRLPICTASSSVACILMVCLFAHSKASGQNETFDYPPAMDVAAAASDEELKDVIHQFWHCELTHELEKMEKLASVIERTGIQRQDPYLQARGLVRRAWVDIGTKRWSNGAVKKLKHARLLTQAPPDAFPQRADYVIARSETLLFHGSLKFIYGLPGKPKGDVDISEGLAMSWQADENDLLFFAHAFAFRVEHLRNRGISGMFLVTKAEHYADLSEDQEYINAARCMRFLAYKDLMLNGTDEMQELCEDTLQNYPEASGAWLLAQESLSSISEEIISNYLAFARDPDSNPDFKFSFNTASDVINSFAGRKVNDDTLALAELMVDQATRSNSSHTLFYSVMKKAEVLAQLKRDDEFFALATKYFPRYMEEKDYFLASRLALVARLRAEVGSSELQKEWTANAHAANRRTRANSILQAVSAAQFALQTDHSTRTTARLRSEFEQKRLYAEQLESKRRLDAEQLTSKHQRQLQASRMANIIWGALTLVFLLIGTTSILFVRSRALASRQAELEREVEDRIHAESRLRQAQQENIRHQRLNALGEMAAGVAHDVNNCLSPIGIYSSLMTTEEFSKKEVKEFAQTIENCVTDATILIQRLHPFYRKSFKDRSEIEVSEIVSQMAATARAQLGGRPIVVNEDVSRCQFVCSASDIREVLVNLTNNAFDAMGESGQLTIRAKLQNEHLILEVEDSGPGMSEETKANCLYAFFSTKSVHGSGLGLATTNAVVQSYRGVIEIESELGKGTLFRIVLPSATASESSPIQMGDTDIPEGCRILVVDDNKATRTSTQFMLESMGHRIVSCDGGIKAIQKLSDEEFDLLLTDYKMPEMNGFELCRKVRDLYPSMPIVIMSGFEEPGLREVCDAILAKPISISSVKAAMHRAQSAVSTTLS